MSLTIRDVRASDLDAVQAINNAAGEGILPLDGVRLARLHAIADYFRIAEEDGRVAGFLIAMRPGTDHDSPNFEWFRQRQPAFVYIDRIVIVSAARGRGLGSFSTPMCRATPKCVCHCSPAKSSWSRAMTSPCCSTAPTASARSASR